MRKRPFNLVMLFMLCVIIVSMLAGASNASAEDVVIIVNSSVTKTDFTKEEIKNIFLGNIDIWPDNSEITVVVSRNKELHDSFLAEYVQVNQPQFDRNWKMVVFAGKGKTPEVFDKAKQIMEYVAATKEAIGYI